jgi:hypothetical protein
VIVSSGTVSSDLGYEWFKPWINGQASGSDFRTAMESDALLTDRFCQYLRDQGYNVKNIAFLSEDETAFGGLPEPAASPCGEPIRLHYPRDIATLRSAYERQAILSPPKPQSSADTPSSSLRGDLSEPSSSEHDTVRNYAGQLTPLTQESILQDISTRLSEKQIQFIILRSTSSLDQIFLSEYLRRAYPEGRVVIDGADLLFNRGAEGRSLRGVMVLSTYPLLTMEQDWTASLMRHTQGRYRTFAQDTSEGVYIAARELFDPRRLSPVPIHDYSPPRWAENPLDGASVNERPATWISVIGHRQFWPLAVLSNTPERGAASSILRRPSIRDDQKVASDGDPSPLRLPTAMWMFLIAYGASTMIHFYFCSNGSIVGPPRARAYFAPIPRWQHPALIALGSLLLALLAVVVAASSGLFSWFVAAHPFEGGWTGILLAISFLGTVAVAFFSCWRNYQLLLSRASSSRRRQAKLSAQSTGRTGVPDSRIIAARSRRNAGLASSICLLLFMLVYIILILKLTQANRIPTYWRNVNLVSGVSGLLTQILLIAGVYLWFWFSLRGLAHFGQDRPRLPKLADLPKLDGTPVMPMFSHEKAGRLVERVALPLTRNYLGPLAVFIAITIGASWVALQGYWVRTLGERAFGVVIFFWVCLSVAVVLADGFQARRTWHELRKLLVFLDRLPLRRTLRALKGLAWGSIWKMSGNVLEERYRVISFQSESLRHLENTVTAWEPANWGEWTRRNAVLEKIAQCRKKMPFFVKWYAALPKDSADLTHLHEFQVQMASIAGTVMTNILVQAWQGEKDSLLFDRSQDRSGPEAKKDEGGTAAEPALSIEDLPPHVRCAEEFFVLPYLAFIQNALGRIRTIVLGSLWLFVGTTLAVSSYPFDPLNVLGGIFLTVFAVIGGLMIVVYSQMSRDATLSHITNTNPGELGTDFWVRLVGFGVGPLIGLLTTLFPSITDFVFSWLEPSVQALK